MSAVRTGETVQDGQVIPESEVVRRNRHDAPFQVREAVTVRLGPRGGRRRMAGRDACPTEATEAPEPGRTFQVREAVTVTLPPPHWAKLTQQKEHNHVTQSGPDTDSREA